MKDHEDHKPNTTKIFVNGQQHDWPKKEITYAEVVELAFPGSTSVYTVTYTHGNKEEQLIESSPPIKAKNKMEFDVDDTVNS